MSEGRYKFYKISRAIAITLTAAVLLYFAFETFRGHHLDLDNSAGTFALIFNLVYLTLHKPVPPNEQTAREASQNK